ncbi:MAG TPA: ArsA family ATPase, partial [Anaeromyxobacteraceae bacterium]
ALFFHERLRREAMPVAGVVANRVTSRLWGEGPTPGAPALAAALAARGAGGEELAERLARTLTEHEVLARADAREVARLFSAVPGAQVAVPRLDTDVHDLASLARLAALL